MVISKSKTCKEGFVSITLLLCVLIFIGCMSTRSAEKQDTAVAFDKAQFTSKTVAVLPVKEKQESAMSGTESTKNLRIAVNDKIGSKLASLMPKTKIINYKTSGNILNEKGKLSLLDDLIKTQENTGTYDYKAIEAICEALNADYIVIGTLKAGKRDMSIVVKGMIASLEVSIISRKTKEVVCGGSGNYKTGGMLGFGGVDDKEAAEELVNLAFSTY